MIDLTQFHQPLFGVRHLCRDAHHHWNSPVDTRHWRRLVLYDRRDERFHFRDKRPGIAFHEKVQRQRCANAVRIAQDAAGYFDVSQRWRGGIAAHDPKNMRPSNFARGDDIVHAPETGIEAAVEADLQFNACLLHGGEGTINVFQIERDGFFTKDVSSVGIICRSDSDRTDLQTTV